jgi:acetyl-CoA acetyltransferase
MTSMPTRWSRRSAPPPRAPRAASPRSVVPVKDWLGQTILDEDEFIKPRTTMEGLASLKPAFDQMGAMGFDAVALQRYPQVERIQHVHHAGNSSGIVDGARGNPDRQRGGRQDAQAEAACPHRGRGAVGSRPDHHADRPPCPQPARPWPRPA